MKINSKVIFAGRTCSIEYNDADDFSEVPRDLCTQIYGVCFYDDQVVLVHSMVNNKWGLVGGTIEAGETFEEALKREIQEESNMELVAWKPIGYQKIVYEDNGETLFQLRAVCKVRPFGEFVSDPDGDVDMIKLINPDDYREYFDWGDTSQRIMEVAKNLITTL